MTTRPVLVLSALPRRVLAFPLSYAPAVTATTYIPLIVVSIALFLVVSAFLAIKLVYMEQRRVGTTHSPPVRKRADRQTRGFLVGLLGSPTWETNSWRRGYQLHAGSMRSGSRLTELTRCSGDGDHLLASSVSCRIPSRGSSSSRVSHASTGYHLRYGDFGEFHCMRSPGSGLPQSTRRASPSSIRLVDGPSQSNQVEYTFLSRLPPRAVLASPLMGTRDSIQLSRRSVNRHRKPAPPLPSMPFFLPFHAPNTLEPCHGPQTNGYLPTLRFSPLASVAKKFHPQQQTLEEKISRGRTASSGGRKHLDARTTPSYVSKTAHTSSDSSWTLNKTPAPHHRRPNAKSNHQRSQLRRGLAIAGPLPETLFLDGDAIITTLTERNDIDVSSFDRGITSKKPLKSCLRQTSAVPTPSVGSPDVMLTPSEISTQTSTLGTQRSTSDQASLRTPISDVDIGMLGLDRFRWSEDDIKELKVRSCHLKKDSVALVPVWE